MRIPAPAKLKIWVLTGFLFSFYLVSCTRTGKDNETKISISIPQTMKSQKVGSLASSTLSHVSINISGIGLSSPIVFNWDSENNGPAGSVTTTAPTSFSFDIPKGPDRLFQILAVYSDSSSNSGSMQFYYGDQIKSMVAATEEVPINISSVGQSSTIISGRIQGRYLTSPSEGPTGRVDIVYFPPGGKSPMIVDRSMILSGWFQFFGLIGAQFGYRLQDGSLLWGGPVDLSETSFPVSDKVLRATLPSHIQVENYSGTSSQRLQDPSISIYGFFGAPAALTNKAICKTTTALTQLLKIGTSTPLTVTDNNSADPTNLFDTSLGSINLRGGVALGGSAPCDTQANISAHLLDSVLGFKPSLLEHGNDNSAGFRLPFLIPASDSNGGGSFIIPKIVDAGTISISGTLLPGISNNLDSFTVFKATNLGMNFNYRSSFAPCEALQGMGYNLVANTPVSSSNYSANLPLTDAEASSGAMFALCPTKSGVPVGPGFWVQASYLRNSGGCSSCGGDGGGGGAGGGSAVPTTVGFQNLTAITINQCTNLNLGLFTNSGGSASSSNSVTVNLSATVSGTFYSQNDFSCSGGAITSVVIPANFNWIGVRFKSSATPETDIVLTPTDAASTLSSISKTLRVRSSGSVTNLMLNTNSQAANIGTCLGMSVQTTDTSGSVISYNGDVSITANGATIYTDPGCTATGGTFSFAAGITSFYIKSSTTGWASIQANANIDSINFTSFYGIGIFPLGQPTHLTFSSPSPSYLFINQCMPLTVTAKDDTNTVAPVPSNQVIKFNASGGAGSNFYSDSNCLNLMNNSESPISAGQSSVSFYYKPQNIGNININASINGNNYYMNGSQNYNIANLWMHAIAVGFNASWYDSNCGTLTFQLMDNPIAGSGNTVPNLSGSFIPITIGTNQAIVNGGLYSASDCSDAVVASKNLSITSGTSSSVVYMKSLLAGGNFVNVFPSYSGAYSSIYPNGNTLTGTSYAWCPPLDGGGACASSLSPSGTNVGGGVALYTPAVSIGSSADKTITITNTTGTFVSLSPSFTITGSHASDYNFKGGSYPGTGGSCVGGISGYGSCTVVVTFTPSAINGRYATLNINYNTSKSLPLYLQGTGQ